MSIFFTNLEYQCLPRYKIENRGLLGDLWFHFQILGDFSVLQIRLLMGLSMKTEEDFWEPGHCYGTWGQWQSEWVCDDPTNLQGPLNFFFIFYFID